ncbi:hypothetical protein TGME49_233510 [Toxoplasma gondii ME49]|uniref:Uncharacterized protein n=3 Tax=Toxoplasma gondii TaxID=5811 RepID=B6KK37_TOXGV|nr:hypothetical protein TGME49_233510 [Toxoplasma gondii ME49]EPT28759.1 hypothetical protein TGME49_233510 [Toxoplasma gondii ME49]ESS35834.1 hypothetical protein TGVEG_233510 [Toxoplasma gondii VEG]KYF46334.1 hypothetical protein TGARI_233510 [Toxoplasma gondii ARI]CEL75012.1 TPA: hypothetical protein BN1205_022020 [Toxoplasma gondii VEG]|eukprot:XP_002368210.1 hypothetical protein TGME49_233510 [Toxoplasma gondii ME49]
MTKPDHDFNRRMPHVMKEAVCRGMMGLVKSPRDARHVYQETIVRLSCAGDSTRKPRFQAADKTERKIDAENWTRRRSALASITEKKRDAVVIYSFPRIAGVYFDTRECVPEKRRETLTRALRMRQSPSPTLAGLTEGRSSQLQSFLLVRAYFLVFPPNCCSVERKSQLKRGSGAALRHFSARGSANVQETRRRDQTRRRRFLPPFKAPFWPERNSQTLFTTRAKTALCARRAASGRGGVFLV